MNVFDEEDLFGELQGGVLPSSAQAGFLLAMCDNVPENNWNLTQIFSKLGLPFKTQENIR